MSSLFSYLKKNISFGKGIMKLMNNNIPNNKNIIYKEIIKWNCDNTSILYPYGNYSSINYSLISKEIKPFEIISSNNIQKINDQNIQIIYFGKKEENKNVITYQIEDNSKVLYLVYKSNNIKKIILYLL
jgi:hypothetical protein